jgi:hypothetical protein
LSKQPIEFGDNKMRTTLNLSEDALEKVKEFAESRSLSLGEATSVLVMRGVNQTTPVRKDGHFFVFSPGEDAEIVTLEHALKIEDESE